MRDHHLWSDVPLAAGGTRLIGYRLRDVETIGLVELEHSNVEEGLAAEVRLYLETVREMVNGPTWNGPNAEESRVRMLEQCNDIMGRLNGLKWATTPWGSDTIDDADDRETLQSLRDESAEMVGEVGYSVTIENGTACVTDVPLPDFDFGEDIFISPDRGQWRASTGGEEVGVYRSCEAAVLDVTAYMAETGYYPMVWVDTNGYGYWQWVEYQVGREVTSDDMDQLETIADVLDLYATTSVERERADLVRAIIGRPLSREVK